MSYEHPPYRPPSEAGSVLFRLTRGCPWNQCTFCSMYKDTPFERRPVDDIVQDIQRAKEIYGSHTTTFFFGDSNSLILDASTLEQILHSLYDNFQNIDRVTSYARARTLCKKSLEDLRRIRKAGLTRLHIGLETGDAELLNEIRKGATPDQMVEGCVRAKEAGFEVSLYVLAGIAGEAKWRQHAIGTADVINRVNPHFIRIRTYVPTPYSPLCEREKNNQFQLASPETILREQYLLIDLLEVTSQYLSDHISNYVPVYGMLPDDKDRMLETLDRAIEDLSSNQSYRRSLEMKRHLTQL
jgi:radical SAM superfamily enzyme YgiQ (UPF0313 family)